MTTTQSPIHRYKHIIRIVGIFVALLALASIGYQLWQSWHSLQGITMNPLFAFLALLVGMLTFLSLSLLWHKTIQQLGYPLRIPIGMRIWFLSQVVRYAPGNVWQFFGRVYLANKEGIAAQSISLSMVFELLQTITAGLLVAALSLVFWQQLHVLSYATLLLIPLIVWYVSPQLLQRPLNWLFQQIRLPSDALVLHRRDLLVLLPGYCVSWVLFGMVLYLLTYAVYPLPLSQLPAITGIFAIAWILGFLSFITPSGLGVREGILGMLLGTLMPMPIALLVTVLSRVFLTLAELCCVALVVLIPTKSSALFHKQCDTTLQNNRDTEDMNK